MNFADSLAQGMITAIGMFIMMTVLSILSWIALKKWIIRNITEVWKKVKEEGIKLDGLTVEGTFKTKKANGKGPTTHDKSCGNCRFSALVAWSEPCNSCEHTLGERDNWESQ